MEAEIRQLVRRVVGKVLAERGGAPQAGGQPATDRALGVHVHVEPSRSPDRPGRGSDPQLGGRGPQLVSEACLARTPDGGAFEVPPGALVTPAAEEEAWRRGIRLERGAGDGRGAGRGSAVAVGADHGGFAMKQEVLAWVREAGFQPLDFGTRDENPVDYPDIARAVAEAVARGQCRLGILVDGAGIGSAMAANKVPGVRAAMCYDEATARNSREHNYANVLTLGGRMLSADVARRVVQAFLATPEGAERHGRRVAKITAIERAYARPSS